MNKLAIGIYILSGLANSVNAELKVIADLGGEEASSYFAGIARQPELPLSTIPGPTQKLPMVAESAMLPVSTPELTPGEVADRLLDLPGLGTLYIVGDDPASYRWLQQYAGQLKARSAVGLVVNVRQYADLQALRQQAPGVMMVAASGGDLARRLQLSHYPLVITERGISQQVTP